MQAVAQAVATAAPKVVEEVRRRAPAVLSRAEQWFASRGTTLEAVAKQAATSGDRTMGAVLFEGLTSKAVAGRDAQTVFRAMAAAAPNLDVESMKNAAQQLAIVKSKELANAISHHEKLDGADQVARLAEVSRLINRGTRLLGVSEDELNELLLIFANIGPEDISTLKAFKSASALRSA